MNARSHPCVFVLVLTTYHMLGLVTTNNFERDQVAYCLSEVQKNSKRLSINVLNGQMCKKIGPHTKSQFTFGNAGCHTYACECLVVRITTVHFLHR